jgi:hypothetical protein
VDFSFESPEPSKISGRKKAFNIHLLNEWINEWMETGSKSNSGKQIKSVM